MSSPCSGKGLGIDVFHCMRCNQCMSLSLADSHTLDGLKAKVEALMAEARARRARAEALRAQVRILNAPVDGA